MVVSCVGSHLPGSWNCFRGLNILDALVVGQLFQVNGAVLLHALDAGAQ